MVREINHPSCDDGYSEISVTRSLVLQNEWKENPQVFIDTNNCNVYQSNLCNDIASMW